MDNSSERLNQHSQQKRTIEKKTWLGMLEGVDIFPDLRMLIIWRAEERREDTAQPGDSMPIGAWPFSRVLCQRCQFDGRCRPKWHFSRVGKSGQKRETSQVVKEKEGKKHRKASISINGVRVRWLFLSPFGVISPGVKCTKMSYLCENSIIFLSSSICVKLSVFECF